MITRRKFSMLASSVGAVGLGAGGMMASSCADGATAVNSTDTFRMPDESEPHTRTWMGFGASEAIWGKTLLPVVRRNLALIANTIAKYEPVSMLVRANEMDIAKGLLGNGVTLVEANLDDFWLRDTGPVFVLNQQKRVSNLISMVGVASKAMVQMLVLPIVSPVPPMWHW